MLDRRWPVKNWFPKALAPILLGALLATGCAAQPAATPEELTTSTPSAAPVADTPFPTATQLPASPTTRVNSQPTATQVPAPEPTSTPAAPEELASDIRNFALESLTVPVGTTVTWTNQDGASHTTTSGTPQSRDGVWDSQVLRKSDKFSFIFSEPGEFPYFCAIHNSMRGTITVTR